MPVDSLFRGHTKFFHLAGALCGVGIVGAGCGPPAPQSGVVLFDVARPAGSFVINCELRRGTKPVASLQLLFARRADNAGTPLEVGWVGEWRTHATEGRITADNGSFRAIDDDEGRWHAWGHCTYVRGGRIDEFSVQIQKLPGQPLKLEFICWADEAGHHPTQSKLVKLDLTTTSSQFESVALDLGE